MRHGSPFRPQPNRPAFWSSTASRRSHLRRVCQGNGASGGNRSACSAFDIKRRARARTVARMSRAEHWRARAKEAVVTAQHLAQAEAKAAMLAVATGYLDMAEQ